jgi:hypothetical protein
LGVRQNESIHPKLESRLGKHGNPESQQALGYTLYLGMPYYGRWIWSAAKMLVDKKHISLNELLEKIAEVRSRHESK